MEVKIYQFNEVMPSQEPVEQEETCYADRIINNPCPRVRVGPDEECWECDLEGLPKGWAHNGLVSSLMKMREPKKRKEPPTSIDDLSKEVEMYQQSLREKATNRRVKRKVKKEEQLDQIESDEMRTRSGLTYNEDPEPTQPKPKPKAKAARKPSVPKLKVKKEEIDVDQPEF